MFYWKNNLSQQPTFNKGRHLLSMFVVLLVSATVSSCGRKDDSYAGYFSVDSLVSVQIKYLTQTKASVQKVSRLNSQQEEKTLTPADSIAWGNELDIFRELESVNKPINRDAYTVQYDLPDSKSNLKVMVVESKKDTKMSRELPIKYLKIYYQDNKHHVRKVEARLDEQNVLFKGTRLFTLEFQNIHQQLMLTSYRMEGGQKMFLGDTVAYAIQGVITLPN